VEAKLTGQRMAGDSSPTALQIGVPGEVNQADLLLSKGLSPPGFVYCFDPNGCNGCSQSDSVLWWAATSGKSDEGRAGIVVGRNRI
jgi:hypothetical protein